MVDKSEIKAVVDARNARNPMPIYFAKKKLYSLSKGSVIQLDCSDIESKHDIESWCFRAGYQYMGETNNNSFVSFYIKK